MLQQFENIVIVVTVVIYQSADLCLDFHVCQSILKQDTDPRVAWDASVRV